MHIDAITESDAHRIATAKVCEELPKNEWCEEGSVLFALRKVGKITEAQNYDINSLDLRIEKLESSVRGLTASDGVNSNAIEMLLERVKVLEKEVEKL